jgi:signal transduction histidine kinase
LPVRADRIHLLQVMLNLANNGLDAMSDAASIDRGMTIGTILSDDSWVEVSVSDSGPGIPEDQLGAVFDAFYTTKKQGTGLGFSIARAIVEAYGGKIWAENGTSGGAILRFALPLSAGTSNTTQNRSHHFRSPPSGRLGEHFEHSQRVSGEP